MKKSVILFCARPTVYLTELPLIILLAIAIIFNDSSTELLKLYPLIAVISAGIILLFLYFFRAVVITNEEIKIIGRFSSRDKAVINKGKRLSLTLKPRHRLTLELFDSDGKAPELDWAQRDEAYVPMEVNVFRERAISGARGVRRILKYFGVTDDVAEKLLSEKAFKLEHGALALSSEKKEDIRVIDITFNETL